MQREEGGQGTLLESHPTSFEMVRKKHEFFSARPVGRRLDSPYLEIVALALQMTLPLIPWPPAQNAVPLSSASIVQPGVAPER